jgi:hypothetical protein
MEGGNSFVTKDVENCPFGKNCVLLGMEIDACLPVTLIGARCYLKTVFFVL